MNTTALELENIYDLAYKALSAHGCDHFNADSVATTVSHAESCLLYTSPSPRDLSTSRMPSSA